jgi:hypothetical protein
MSIKHPKFDSGDIIELDLFKFALNKKTVLILDIDHKFACYNYLCLEDGQHNMISIDYADTNPDRVKKVA